MIKLITLWAAITVADMPPVKCYIENGKLVCYPSAGAKAYV